MPNSHRKILVTQRVVQAVGYTDPRDAVSQDWIRWLDQHGFAPILVPNVLADPVAFAADHAAHALLLTNGEDVHPSLTQNGGVPTDDTPERDATEARLYAWARHHRLPVLAVCRGFQLVQVLHGGRLGAIPAHADGTRPHVATRHPLRWLPAADRLGELAAEPMVNSFHNQGIPDGALAPDLLPIAASLDGWLEAYIHKSEPLLAIQWHPEREGPNHPIQSEWAVRFLREGAWWKK